MKIKRIVAGMIVLAIIMAISGCSNNTNNKRVKYPYGLSGNEKNTQEIVNKLNKELKVEPNKIDNIDEKHFSIEYRGIEDYYRNNNIKVYKSIYVNNMGDRDNYFISEQTSIIYTDKNVEKLDVDESDKVYEIYSKMKEQYGEPDFINTKANKEDIDNIYKSQAKLYEYMNANIDKLLDDIRWTIGEETVRLCVDIQSRGFINISVGWGELIS